MNKSFHTVCPSNMPILENGTAPEVTEHNSWNQTAVYKCMDDYALNPPDDNTKQCVVNGDWTGTLGTCFPGKIN